VPDELLSRSFAVRGRDFERAGEASTEIKSLLKELEIDPAVIRRTVVIAFEAEMNVVMYADEGTVTFVLTDEDIGVEIADRGPGIPDLDLALQEGWSTATDEMREMGFGFGMGLPNIRRNSDEFSVKSQVGEGTVVSSRISLDGAP
jgi:anti-sigma regulatory factor (Ser/Thr protein kinase)